MEADIQQIKDVIIPILKQAGVGRSSIFGSFVRGETTPESDIDILVDLPKGKSLFDLVELKLQLEEALQKKVDVLTYRSISPFLADVIKREEVQIL